VTRVLVTGARGFIGTHFRVAAGRNEHIEVEVASRGQLRDPDALRAAVRRCGVVMHLAGRNRADDEELLAVNVELAERVRDACAGLPVHVVFSSSTQRALDNAYGRSKLEAEELLLEGAAAGDYRLSIAELTNVFGPGCRPHYNSVVATFAYQLATGARPRVVIDRALELLWVDDLAQLLVRLCLEAPPAQPQRICPAGDATTVGSLLETLSSFHLQHFLERVVPEATSRLEANLYRTLVSYTPSAELAYRPALHTDARGSLFEVTRQQWQGGQTFFSTSQPGVVRGQHYHTRKFEKFCVVRGEGIIRLRSPFVPGVQEFHVAGDEPVIVDIPVFAVHNLENIGTRDLLALFWASEVYDPHDPDTIPEVV
jgi:UDP-2-acetamido-2,6-beta-L-arabino-hexul-4-ose reductase